MLTTFHQICDTLGVPLAKEKVVWATMMLVFLGILMDGERRILALPQAKVDRAIHELSKIIDSKSTTVKQIQCLTGLLNFLNRAIYPGCAFTRRMYVKAASKTEKLRSYHHIRIDKEFKEDCRVWVQFLSKGNKGIYRPFMDKESILDAEDLQFFTDSSASEKLGFGGTFKQYYWFFGQWEKGYIKKFRPSIEYLELYAVCIGVFAWSQDLANKVILIHCDNISVVSMINKMISSCANCMHLIHLLVLRSLNYNFRIWARHVRTHQNGIADSLSRLQFSRFLKLTDGKMADKPMELPEQLWPASKLWGKTYVTKSTKTAHQSLKQ